MQAGKFSALLEEVDALLDREWPSGSGVAGVVH